jgi:glycerophosphoryl diester phosphodiesterase
MEAWAGIAPAYTGFADPCLTTWRPRLARAIVASYGPVVESSDLLNSAIFAILHPMLLFAHRGLHDRKTTENTLEAFRRAVDANTDGIEFDLRMSRDGVPIVIHDENLHRVAGDARRVRDLSAHELQEVVLRGQGGIPTLNDVTAAIPSPTQLDIEIKDRDAIPPLIAKLKTSASLRERVVISSFVSDDLALVRSALPSVRVLLLIRTWPLLFRGRIFWKKVAELAPWAVGFQFHVLNSRRITFLHRRGWKVAAWDVQPLKREARKIARLRPDMAIVYKVESCS